MAATMSGTSWFSRHAMLTKVSNISCLLPHVSTSGDGRGMRQSTTVHSSSFIKAERSRLLSRTQSTHTATVLMACLLLFVCDELSHNRYGAIQHLVAGTNIIGAYCAHPTSHKSNDAVEELGLIFQRLSLHTGELNHRALPVHSSQPFKGNTSNHNNTTTRSPGLLLSQGHSTFESAALHLQALVLACLSPQPNIPPPTTSFHIIPTATDQLNQWLSHFDAFTSQMDPTESVIYRSTNHLLRTYHIYLSILSRCHPFPTSETLFDQYGGMFAHLMVKAGYLIDTVSTGLLSPLFLIATRYRDTASRRRAIGYLRRCGWEGIRLAMIAHQVVRLEERGVADAVACDDIPAGNRVRALDVSFPEPDGRDGCSLRYTKALVGSVRGFVAEHVFPWPGLGADSALQDSVRMLLARVLRFDFVGSICSGQFSSRL